MRTFDIDGAIVFPDVKITKDVFTIPTTINREYKYATITNELPKFEGNTYMLASKDKKEWCIALAYEISGKTYYLPWVNEIANLCHEPGADMKGMKPDE